MSDPISAFVHGHAVQLFDSHETAAMAIAQYVRQGLANNERVILIARFEDWSRAAVDLSRDVSLAEAIASGELTVCNSARTLDALLVDGWPSPDAFERVVTPLILETARDGRQVRAYGDMVDVLSAERRYDAAASLEELWNGLQQRLPFTLFCGYSSGHFCDAACGDSLQRIRQLHAQELCAHDDLVAADLLQQSY